MRYKKFVIFSIIFFSLILISCMLIKIINGKSILLEEVFLEVGIKDIKISDFYKEGKVSESAKLITDISSIDLNKVADYNIIIKENNNKNIVKLHLVDTTSPEVEFKDVVAGIKSEINPQDFIVSVKDFSNVTYEIENKPEIKEYKDYYVTVIVKDEYNNITKKECKLTTSILSNEYVLELGEKLKKEDILYDNNAIKYLKDEDINRINNSGVGNYEIKMTYNNKVYVCKITIKDTLPPVLTLKDITIYLGEKIKSKNDFISNVSDISGDVVTELKNSYNLSKEGTQEIIIEATDKYGNKIAKTAKLTIKKDKDAPVFSGLSDIEVEKNNKPNYEKGVFAHDKKDRNVEFKVDDSKVDLSKYGTYYVIYIAKDKAGNVASKKRKVVVNHDSYDLKKLVNEYAEKAGKDYESIRLYVQKLIKYNDNWGKPDPVWYGLTNFQGNCYVHALIYKAFLDKNGYENKLIWTTDKSHYWNLIKLNGLWRHSDSTPGTKHVMISAETDEVRLEHLQGRDWDHDAWPEAK